MPLPIEVPPDHPIGSLVLRIARGARAPIDSAAARLHEVEARVGLGIIAPGFVPPEAILDAVAVGDDESDMVAALLEATALVIDGEAMQIALAIVDRNRCGRDFTFDEWGHHVARWANRTLPLGGAPRALPPCPCPQCRATPPGGYHYLDFKAGGALDRLFADYGDWTLAWQEVVRRKVELFGPPFG